MKMILTLVVLGMVSGFALVGCNKTEDTSTTPPVKASTNSMTSTNK